MKISQQTLKILQNFSNICEYIFFKEGNPIITMSPARNVVAMYNHEEIFPEFGIYRLKEFLGAINLFDLDGIDFIFKDKFIIIKYKSNSLKYVTTPTDLIPGYHDIKDPELYRKVGEKCNCSFKLTKDDILRIKKATAILFNSTPSHSTSIKVNVQIENGSGSIKIRNNNDPSSNVFKLNIKDGKDTGVFSFSVDNLMLFAGDYQVSILNKKMIVFKHDEIPLTYLITHGVS